MGMERKPDVTHDPDPVVCNCRADIVHVRLPFEAEVVRSAAHADKKIIRHEQFEDHLPISTGPASSTDPSLQHFSRISNDHNTLHTRQPSAPLLP